MIGRAAVAADDHERPHPGRSQVERAVADRRVLCGVCGLDVPLDAGALADRSLVPADPEPREVGPNGLLGARHRALRIGVVDAKQHRAPLAACKQAVHERREGTPQVERAGRARREANVDGHPPYVRTC